MSSVPGGSGENILYTLLCGGAFVGAVSYVSYIVPKNKQLRHYIFFFDYPILSMAMLSNNNLHTVVFRPLKTGVISAFCH